jgi:hypothetical protein
VQFGDPRSLFFITETNPCHLRSECGLGRHRSKSEKADPVLAARVKANPGLRATGLLERFRTCSSGNTRPAGERQRCVDTGRPAGENFRRAVLQRRGGITHIFPHTPGSCRCQRSPASACRSLRAGTIRALAQAVCSGRISFEGVVNSADFLDRLCEIAWHRRSGQLNT